MVYDINVKTAARALDTILPGLSKDRYPIHATLTAGHIISSPEETPDIDPEVDLTVPRGAESNVSIKDVKMEPVNGIAIYRDSGAIDTRKAVSTAREFGGYLKDLLGDDVIVEDLCGNPSGPDG